MQAEGEVVAAPGGQRRGTSARSSKTSFVALYKTLYFVTGDRKEAADLMQDAFLKLWERWDRIDRIDDPVAYLFRVALNGSRRCGLAPAATDREAPRSHLGIVRDPFEDVDLREDVRAMLHTLAPRQRAALVLLDLYGYGSEEAARIMGIRPSTVRALATQGRAVLRTAGGPHG